MQREMTVEFLKLNHIPFPYGEFMLMVKATTKSYPKKEAIRSEPHDFLSPEALSMLSDTSFQLVKFSVKCPGTR